MKKIKYFEIYYSENDVTYLLNLRTGALKMSVGIVKPPFRNLEVLIFLKKFIL